MILVKPSANYKASFLKAYKQFISEDSKSFTLGELIENNFEDYCNTLIGYQKGINLPTGYVNQTTYWLIDFGEYIGQLSIRHSLNEHLLKAGGHIGYKIAPEYRLNGYGTKILALGLVEAEKLGLRKALLTCDVSNTASAKIIEKNGGILENEIFEDERNTRKRRYWITIIS